MSSGVPAKNFWLWGTWGKRRIGSPFLTQKVPGRIRDVVIGHTFIIALLEDKTLISWGEDKQGCLGLGQDKQNAFEPGKINFPLTTGDAETEVIDIQLGRHHVLALTREGKVFTWGENANGQLGHNDTLGRFEPVHVEELKDQTVIQVLAIENMSYALTHTGLVYAWGENKEGALGLEHDSQRVLRPEPMMRMKETKVKKLMVKDTGGTGSRGGKTVIACVEMADPLTEKELPGAFDLSLQDLAKDVEVEESMFAERERDIIEGVNLMRQVMEQLQDWWNRVLKIRHGSPYAAQDDVLVLDDGQVVPDNPQQLDAYVAIEVLDQSAKELDMLVLTAKDQLREVKRKERGTKNLQLVLAMFVDDLLLRLEKIRSTSATRNMTDSKRNIIQNVVMRDLDKREDREKLDEANTQLTRLLLRIRQVKASSVFNRELQASLAECIELKLQVHETQLEYLKARRGQQSDVLVPALRVIKERWTALKEFSIYNLYRDFQMRGSGGMSFNSDEDLLEYLAQTSDSKIDQIIAIDIARDLMTPAICYDLLLENAELRKMCNRYQLRVLNMRNVGAVSTTNSMDSSRMDSARP